MSCGWCDGLYLSVLCSCWMLSGAFCKLQRGRNLSFILDFELAGSAGTDQDPSERHLDRPSTKTEPRNMRLSLLMSPLKSSKHRWDVNYDSHFIMVGPNLEVRTCRSNVIQQSGCLFLASNLFRNLFWWTVYSCSNTSGSLNVISNLWMGGNLPEQKHKFTKLNIYSMTWSWHLDIFGEIDSPDLSSHCRRVWGCPGYHLRLRRFSYTFVWLFKALTRGGRNSWSLFHLHDCNYTSDETWGTFRGAVCSLERKFKCRF